MREAEKTRFSMQLFNAIKGYVGRWEIDKEHRVATRKRRGLVAACPLCDASGYVTFEDSVGKLVVHQCPHDQAMIAAIESSKRYRRIAPACG